MIHLFDNQIIQCLRIIPHSLAHQIVQLVGEHKAEAILQRVAHQAVVIQISSRSLIAEGHICSFGILILDRGSDHLAQRSQVRVGDGELGIGAAEYGVDAVLHDVHAHQIGGSIGGHAGGELLTHRQQILVHGGQSQLNEVLNPLDQHIQRRHMVFEELLSNDAAVILIYACHIRGDGFLLGQERRMNKGVISGYTIFLGVHHVILSLLVALAIIGHSIIQQGHEAAL